MRFGAHRWGQRVLFDGVLFRICIWFEWRKSTRTRCVGFIDWEPGHSLAVFVESGSRLGAFGSGRRIEEPLCSP
jgi:hypothetical protein